MTRKRYITSYTEGRRARGFSRPCLLCVQKNQKDEMAESQHEKMQHLMTFVAIKLFYFTITHFIFSLLAYLRFVLFVRIHNINRFFASEIIRGALFTKLGKELPYCCEVRIDEFREPKPGDAKAVTRIKATVCVERDSQKGIVVGKGGVKIKEIGVEAREKLEEFLQTKVFLNLDVKVDKDWRRDEKKLKAFGYLK